MEQRGAQVVTKPSVNVDDVAARAAAAVAENARYAQLKGQLMRWAVALGACGSGLVFALGTQARRPCADRTLQWRLSRWEELRWVIVLGAWGSLCVRQLQRSVGGFKG